MLACSDIEGVESVVLKEFEYRHTWYRGCAHVPEQRDRGDRVPSNDALKSLLHSDYLTWKLASAICRFRLTRSPLINTNPESINCCPVQSNCS